jgi:hypothetical protein
VVAYPMEMLPEKLHLSGTKFLPPNETFGIPLENPLIITSSFFSDVYRK